MGKETAALLVRLGGGGGGGKLTGLPRCPLSAGVTVVLFVGQWEVGAVGWLHRDHDLSRRACPARGCESLGSGSWLTVEAELQTLHF